MAVIVFTLPFSHSVGVRNIAIGVALCAVTLGRRTLALAVRRIPLLWFFGLLAALGGLSLVWSLDPPYSLHELKSELVNPFLVFALAFTVTRGWRVLGWLALAAALATALSLVGPIGAWSDYAGATRSLFYNGAGFYSTWLVIVYPFALAAWLSPVLALRWRRLALALAVLVLIGGVLSLNRAFPVVVGVETVILAGWDALRRRSPSAYLRVGLAIIIAAALLGGLAAIQKERVTKSRASEQDVLTAMERDVRWALWRDAVDRIASNPWRGAGFGRGVLRHDLRKRHANADLWHAHNTVLDYGLQMGVPGIALILALFGAALWHLARAYKTSDEALRPYLVAAMVMVVAFFLKNQTDDFFVRQPALSFWAALGTILGMAAHAARKHAESAAAPK